MPSSAQSSLIDLEDWSSVLGFVTRKPLGSIDRTIKSLSWRVNLRVVQFRKDLGMNSERLLKMPFAAYDRSTVENHWIVFPVLREPPLDHSRATERLLSYSLQAALITSAALEHARDIDTDSLVKLAVMFEPAEKAGYVAAKYVRRVLLSIVERENLPCKVLAPERLCIEFDWQNVTANDVRTLKKNSSVLQRYHQEIGSICQHDYRIGFSFWDSTYSTVRGRFIRTADEADAILLSASLDTQDAWAP